MRKKQLKIILDTNLWIQFLISKSYSSLDEYLVSKKVRLLFSEELLQELLDVVSRPKLKKYFNNNHVSQLMRLINVYGEFVNVKSQIEQCRDPKDDFLLSLSVDGKADYFITGDKDLLEMKKIQKTKICTYSYFMETMLS